MLLNGISIYVLSVLCNTKIWGWEALIKLSNDGGLSHVHLYIYYKKENVAATLQKRIYWKGKFDHFKQD